MPDITQLLHEIDDGDSRAAAQLLPLVYDELRKLAAARMAAEREDHTLQATALVHEAYLRLVGSDDGAQKWNGRRHFFGAAAEAMRRILVEAGRKRVRREALRGAQVPLDGLGAGNELRDEQLIRLDDALERLEALNPEKAELVKLRYFAGLTLSEAAALLGISGATADRHWKYARGWLSREMRTANADTR